MKKLNFLRRCLLASFFESIQVLFHFYPDCYYLGCEHLCVEVLPGVKGCQCEEGYQLGPDRQTCIAKGSFQLDKFAPYAKRLIFTLFIDFTKHL